MKERKRVKMKESIERDLGAEALTGEISPILIVDDDRAVRTILSTLLSTMGFQVTQATNGHEALDLFSKERFGVVLTDFQMPGMDGFALASSIKISSPKTPVIMITGSDQSVVQEKMRTGCVDSVLFKPFKLQDIHQRIMGALTSEFAFSQPEQDLAQAQKGE
jgi:CheY-like chemotaxis protein